ncbi:MAG: hypothetical protein ABSC48_05930 [Terracidiphilus sp.]|jgi:hypothetical protein
MKRMSCEYESGVIRAWHAGEWTPELRLHAAECEDCGEALRLAEALRAEARRADERCNPPDSHWILRRSQRMAREIALRRMDLLLKTMRALSAIYVAVAAGWLLRGYAEVQYREIASVLHGASSEFALMAATVAAVCVVAGLWPILREDAARREAGFFR